MKTTSFLSIQVYAFRVVCVCRVCVSVRAGCPKFAQSHSSLSPSRCVLPDVCELCDCTDAFASLSQFCGLTIPYVGPLTTHRWHRCKRGGASTAKQKRHSLRGFYENYAALHEGRPIALRNNPFSVRYKRDQES